MPDAIHPQALHRRAPLGAGLGEAAGRVVSDVRRSDGTARPVRQFSADAEAEVRDSQGWLVARGTFC